MKHEVEDNLKKGMYAGIGAMSEAAHKSKEFVERMAKKGEKTVEHAKERGEKITNYIKNETMNSSKEEDTMVERLEEKAKKTIKAMKDFLDE